MQLLLLALALLDRPANTAQLQVIVCNEIEINEWGTCEHKQTQLIYKRWRYGRMCVIGWKIGKADEINETAGVYSVRHRGYLIRAETIRQTHTTYDTERREFSRWGYGERVQELCGGF